MVTANGNPAAQKSLDNLADACVEAVAKAIAGLKREAARESERREALFEEKMAELDKLEARIGALESGLSIGTEPAAELDSGVETPRGEK